MPPLSIVFHKFMITITLPLNATLTRPLVNSLYHLYLHVKLILNSILLALLYRLGRKVVLMAQVIFRRLQMPACESKVLSTKRILLLMQFLILRVVTGPLSPYDVPSSLGLSTQSWMKTICAKLRCFTLAPEFLIQQLFSRT